MYIPLPILLALGAAFLVLLALALRGSGGRRDLLRPPAPQNPVRLPTDTERQVRALIVQGKKIEAIRLVRAAARVDLKGAKQAVEGLARQVLNKVGESKSPDTGWTEAVSGRDGFRYERSYTFNEELRDQDARGSRGEFNTSGE
jgi:hypothetical protein